MQQAEGMSPAEVTAQQQPQQPQQQPQQQQQVQPVAAAAARQQTPTLTETPQVGVHVQAQLHTAQWQNKLHCCPHG